MARLLVLAHLNIDLTLYSLCHTHTSLIAETGITLKQIMDRFHSDNEITKKIYLHNTKK